MDNQSRNILFLSKQDTAVLKGIAIVAMLMHHLWGCPPAGVESYTGILGFLGSVGKVCVAIFLFCSGYGLSVGYSKIVDKAQGTAQSWKCGVRETLKFMAKRFVKFYSGYWLIFLIFVPISVFVFDRPLSVAYGENVNYIKHIVIDLLGVHGFHSYNITWWFNKLIIMLYIIFPLLYFGIKKGSWIFALVSLICMRFSDGLGGINYYEILLWQCPMVFGILWHEKENSFNKVELKKMAKLALSIVLVTFLTILFLYRDGVVSHIPHIKAGIYIDPFIVVVMTLCVVLIRNYSKYIDVIFAFLGKHSMNIYMTHTFFFSYWFSTFFYSRELGGGMNIVALLAICMLVSMALEWLKEITRWNKISNIIIEKIDKL